MNMDSKPKLIAIVGGSGAGKSWLADRLQQAFATSAARLSLDNFYLDRADLPPSHRARVNFDHPRAIDWPRLQTVLRACRAGRTTRIPQYNFATHTRMPHEKLWAPAPLVLVDGLWLLSRPRVRSLFALGIYLDCPAQLRLKRRLARDVAERGRTPDSVRDQFWKEVEPMHDRHVIPQLRLAHVVLGQPVSEAEMDGLIARIRALAPGASPAADDARPGFPRAAAPPRGPSMTGRFALSGPGLAPDVAWIGGMDFEPARRGSTTGWCYA